MMRKRARKVSFCLHLMSLLLLIIRRLLMIGRRPSGLIAGVNIFPKTLIFPIPLFIFGIFPRVLGFEHGEGG